MLKIRRRRRFKFLPFSGSGMFESQLPGVQHLSWKGFREFTAINLVAQHWMPQVMKMDANLVSAATV